MNYQHNIDVRLIVGFFFLLWCVYSCVGDTIIFLRVFFSARELNVKQQYTYGMWILIIQWLKLKKILMQCS